LIRLNIPWIIDVTSSLERLDEVQAGRPYSEVIHLLYFARYNLDAVYQDSVYNQHLKISRSRGFELRNAIDAFTEKYDRTPEISIEQFDGWTIRNARDRFRELFLAEISAVPAYLVTRKEGYDVELLIDYGASLFPVTLSTKVPEALRDAGEAGKALAFEVATGCGFHAFRVVESVVRRYWDEVTEGRARPRPETLGNFAAELEKSRSGDAKIIESIKQMTRLHRNPIAHPEVLLSVEEAIGIIGIARSVTGAMLLVLPDLPLTVDTPSSAR